MRSTSRFIRTIGCLALAAGLAGPLALAQEGPKPSYGVRVSEGLHGEARAAFSRANALFEAANYAAARVEFEQAYMRSGDARVLYNVAVCDKEMGRYARAIAELRRSLEAGGSNLPRSYVKRVQDTEKTLAPFVTTLQVEASEPGATVLVDGEEAGRTPLEQPLPIDVGERVVQLAKPGFRGEPLRIKAVSGVASTVRLALEPVEQKQRVSVRAVGLKAGERADVLVDGVLVGEAPWAGEVLTGQRRVTVRAAGHPDVVRLVNVSAEAGSAVTVELDPAARKGRLRVRSGDEQDTIAVNGRVVGRGAFDGQVTSGELTVRVTRPDAKPYESDFVLRPGETRTVNVTLETSGGGVPTWVWIAGGVVVAGATTATLLLTGKETQYDGQSAGTLPPRVVPASYGGF
jgi:hypothetical protein